MQVAHTNDANGAFREINNLLNFANQFEWIWPWCAKQVSACKDESIVSMQKSIIFWEAYLREWPNDWIAEKERLLCLWLIHTTGSTTKIDFNHFRFSVLQLIESEDPNPAFLWDRIGHWAQTDDNWNEAEKAYREAYNLEPEAYGYCLGTALNFLGRSHEALPILLNQAEEHQPDALSWFQVAIAYEGTANIEQSIDAYHKAIDLDSEYDLAWLNLGWVYWNSCNTLEAISTWKNAVKRFPDHDQTKKLCQHFPKILL